MAHRERIRYRCTGCDSVAAVWNGRCAACGGWNTLAEETVGATQRRVAATDAVRPLAELGALEARAHPVGVAEVDRVLAGGLVAGSITLLSGPPGVGKSTLALQMAARPGAPGGTGAVLYVSAEETVAQVRRRFDRLAADLPGRLLVTDAPTLDVLVAAVEEHRPSLVIVDSIQSIHDPEVASLPGSATQVRGCAQRLAAVARATGASLVLIGHVTKDGSIAGPRLLEHLVDTVLTFDADLDHGLRFLRAIKHRFGPVGELGVFRMHPDGLHGVPDVAGLFLEGRRRGVTGSVVTPVLEGRRSLAVEIQTLVEPAPGGGSVRVCQGLPRGRVELLRAVLERHVGVQGDLYVSAAGGYAVGEPAADLAVVVSAVSAAGGIAVDPSTAVFGEVGLTGEIRGVADPGRRLTDAARLGFDRAVVPATVPDEAVPRGVEALRVDDVAGAVAALFPDTAPRARPAGPRIVAVG